jgi:hypothetical protein
MYGACPIQALVIIANFTCPAFMWGSKYAFICIHVADKSFEIITPAQREVTQSYLISHKETQSVTTSFSRGITECL